MCCDTRRQVRSQALTYLQRALLVHDLQTLSAAEWEACFNKVLTMNYEDWYNKRSKNNDEIDSNSVGIVNFPHQKVGSIDF